MQAKIIVVVNQKGGVGKSTVGFHLAHAALKTPKSRVLCLDLDSQGNLSQYLTGELDVVKNCEGGVGSLFEGKPIAPTKTTHPQIDLLHGHEQLDRFDNAPAAEDHAYAPETPAALRSSGYNTIIIDTPPAVGLRHLAALCWADVAIIPMEPVLSGISGFQNVLSAIENVVAPINPRLRWFAVMNRANMRVRSHREKDEYMRKTYGNRVLATLSTRTAVSDAMEESPAQPVWLRRGVSKELRDNWRNFCDTALTK